MKTAKMTKFEELAERRVSEALHKIKLIGNLSHTGNYDYDENHVKQIVAALRTAVRDVDARFSNRGKAGSDGFRFK